jgi:hypothetical protein
VYTLVSDYSTGIDAEARFNKGFTAGGSKWSARRACRCEPGLLAVRPARQDENRMPCSSSRPARRMASAC